MTKSVRNLTQKFKGTSEDVARHLSFSSGIMRSRKAPQAIFLIFNKPPKFLSLILVMMLLPWLVKQSTRFLWRDNTILS